MRRINETEFVGDGLGAELVASDQSERMVEIQRSKGIDASIGDVQELPFADGEFDVAVAERGETVRVRTHSAVFVAEGPA